MAVKTARSVQWNGSNGTQVETVSSIGEALNIANGNDTDNNKVGLLSLARMGARARLIELDAEREKVIGIIQDLIDPSLESAARDINIDRAAHVAALGGDPTHGDALDVLSTPGAINVRPHWTQTAAGKAKLARAMRKAWKTRRRNARTR